MADLVLRDMQGHRFVTQFHDKTAGVVSLVGAESDRHAVRSAPAPPGAPRGSKRAWSPARLSDGRRPARSLSLAMAAIGGD
jgi:hypothetical protein